MKSKSHQLTRFTIVSTLVALVCVSLAYSQGRPPSMENVTVLMVTLPDGRWIRSRVIEGGMLRIENEDTGSIFGLVPVVRSRNSVTLRVLQVTRVERGETHNEVDTLDVSFGSSRATSTTPSFNVELEAIVRQLPTRRRNTSTRTVSYLSQDDGLI